MRNRKEGFLKNIHLHISKQQHMQKNNNYQNKNKKKSSVILMKSSEIDNCEICGHVCGTRRNACDVINKVQ